MAATRPAVVLLAVILSASPAAAEGDDDEPGAADAGAGDVHANPGKPIERGAVRPFAPVRACSLTLPLCVRTTLEHAGPAALGALASAERAHRALRGGLRLKGPEPSLDTGAFDLYLVPAETPSVTHIEERDPTAAFDRARGFSVVDAQIPPGCGRDLAIARAIAGGARLGVAPATDPTTMLAQIEHIARLGVPCAAVTGDAAATFQAHPSRALSDAWVGLDPSVGRLNGRGAWIFWEWLDRAHGIAPGAIVRALWALSPTTTPPGAPRWFNRPDTFDVLRASFAGFLPGAHTTVDDLYLDFAVARTFTDAEGGAAAPDWDVPWPTRPVALAPREPLRPTGSMHVVVRTKDAPPGARLRVALMWEEHAKMRASLVRVDEHGKEIGRLQIAVAHRKVTDAATTLVDLAGAREVRVVVVNAGDPVFGFDPDDDVHEPHGLVVHLSTE